jgi:N-acetylmuramoyl-L-alanine amidase
MRVHFTSVQSAAFVVLKSPDVPSVLMEAGYISHPDDAALLASREGQQTFADVTAKAIRAYFARKSGGAG